MYTNNAKLTTRTICDFLDLLYADIAHGMSNIDTNSAYKELNKAYFSGNTHHSISNETMMTLKRIAQAFITYIDANGLNDEYAYLGLLCILYLGAK